MCLKNKNNFWNQTIIYGFGFVVLRTISFLLLPLYTNLLTTKEAGWVFILYTILAFFNALFSHGMDSSLLKFYNKKNQKEILTTSLLYSLIYSFLLCLILFSVYQYGIFKYFPILQQISSNIILLILFILVADMLSSRIITLIRLLNNPYYYLFVSFINIITSISLNIYFIYMLNLGFLGALYSLAVVSLIQLICLLPPIYNNFRINLFNMVLLKQMVRFSVPFLPATIFFIIIEMSDRWMLGWLGTIESVGLYGAGYKIGSLILLAVHSFNLNWQPYYLKTNLKNAQNQFSNIGTHLIIFLVFMCTALSMVWPLILKLNIGPYYIIGQEFWHGGAIIPIIALSYVFYGVFVLQMPPIYRLNKQKWVPFFWGVGAITNFCVNYLAIPSFGIHGAAYSTLLSYFLMVVCIIYKNYSWMIIKYHFFKIAIVLIVSIVFYSLSLILSAYLLLISIIYSLICISYFIVLLKNSNLKFI